MCSAPTTSRLSIQPWAAKILPNTVCPTTRFQRRLSHRRRRSGKNRAVQEGRKRIAEFAFEQVRARAGTDHSRRHHRYDQRRARLNEKVEFTGELRELTRIKL